MSTGLRAGTNNDGYLQVNGTDVLTALSSGRIGIGTTGPARKVEIVDTAATVLQLNSTSSDGTSLRILHSGNDKMYMGLAGDFIIGQANNVTDSAIRSNGSLLFASGGGTERLRVTDTGLVRVPDSGKFVAGSGDDLQIFHGGTISYIANYTGELIISNQTDNGDISIHSDNGSGGTTTYFRADGSSGAVILNHYGTEKFTTTTAGVEISGATKTDTLEVTQEYPTIRPALDLNFAATKVLDDRITFTRGSVGTYIDELGIVKYASDNTPRFDHDPVTGESLGLLIENSETNLLPYSDGIGSGWANNGTYTNTVTNVNAPDGTAGVTEFLERNTGAYHARYYNTVSVDGSSQYTLSAWLKKGSNYDTNSNGNGNYQIYCSRGTGSVASITIDPTFTTTTGNNVDDRSITQYPNGWIRVSFTFTSNASANVTPHFLFGGGGSYTGNGTNNVYVWGIQFERNSFPSSYIPTSGSTVTRADDFATIKGTNFTDFYNQTEGTLFGEFTIKDTTYSSAAIANINQEPGSSYVHSIMFVEVGTANGYFGRTYKNSSGVNISNSSSVLNSLHPSTTPQKVSFGYTTVSGGELRAYWNGNNVNSSSDLSKVPTTLTNMRIGRGWGGSDVITAHIRKLSYYNKRLPNAQLQGLTQQ